MIRISCREIHPLEGESRRESECRAVGECLAELGLTTRLGHRDDGAPFLEDCPEKRVSVTHSRLYAAVAAGEPSDPAFGIDIEDGSRQQLDRIAPRFMSAAEMEHVKDVPRGKALAWTAKEAVFKAAGRRGVDFVRDIILEPDMGHALLEPEKRRFRLEFRWVSPSQIMCVASECNNSQS